jgi:hypothetical protein
MPLQRAVLICHLLLIAALAASLLPPANAWRVAAALAVTAPLLAALRSLTQSRRKALPWLAVLLVAYVGGVTIEVVARAGGSGPLNIALLAAAFELGLLLALIRRLNRSAREAPG